MKKKGFSIKRVLGIAGKVLLSIVILVVVIFILLHFKFARDIVKGQLVNWAEKKLGMKLEMESLDYNLLKLEFNLKNVTVKSLKGGQALNLPGSRGQVPFFHAKRIGVKVPLSILWKDRPEIDKLEIDKPEVAIFVDQGGNSNIPLFSGEQKGGDEEKEGEKQEKGDMVQERAVPVIFHGVHIQGCKFSYRDQEGGVSMVVPDVGVEIVYEGNNGHKVEVGLKERAFLEVGERRYICDMFRVAALLDMKRVDIESMESRVNGVLLEVKGECRDYLSQLSFHNLGVHGLIDLQAIQAMLPGDMGFNVLFKPGVQGKISFFSELNGALDSPRIEGVIKTLPALPPFNNPLYLVGEVSWKDGELRLKGMHFQWRGWGECHGDGRLHPLDWKKGNELKLGFSHLNLEMLKYFVKGDKNIEGLLAATGVSGKIAMSWDDLDLEALRGNVGIHFYSLEGKEGLTGIVNIRGERGNIDVEMRELGGPGVSANINLNWKRNQLTPLSGNFQVETTLLAGVLPAAFLQGPLKLEGSLWGGKKKVGVKVKILNEGLTSLGMLAEVDLQGGMGVDGRLTIPSYRLERLLEQVDMVIPGLTGVVEGEIKGSFNLDNVKESLRVEARLTNVTAGGCETVIKNDGEILLTVEQGNIEIKELKLEGERSNFEIGVFGNIGLGAGQPINVDITAGVDLENLGLIFPDMNVTGELEMKGQIRGSLDDVDWNGYIRVYDGFIGTASQPQLLEQANLGVEIENDGLTLQNNQLMALGMPVIFLQPVQVCWGEGGVMVDRFTFEVGDTQVQVAGGLRSGRGGGYLLDMLFEGVLDLQQLQKIIGSVGMHGINHFFLHVSGDMDNPQVNGTFKIKDSGLEIGEPEIVVSQLEGVVKLENNRVVMEGLEGFLNDGPLKIAGDFAFSPGPGDNHLVDINFRHAKFRYPPGLKTEMSGQLYLTPDHDVGGYSLDGGVEVLQGNFKDIPRTRERTPLYLRLEVPGIGLQGEESFLDRVHLNVRLSTQNPVWVDKEISRSEITASLRLGGTVGSPGVSGRIRIKEGGLIYFNGETFTVDKGIVDFVNPLAIEPYIDLSAYTHIGDYDVTLRLYGLLEAMTPELSSTPPLPKPDIMSLLLTGRVQEDIPAAKFNLEETAVSVFTQIAAGIAQKKIEKIIGLDSVRIDTGVEDKDARITFGKFLSAYHELVVSQNLVDTHKRSFIWRYTPLREIMVELQKSEENEYGVSFNHRFFFDLKKRERDGGDKGDSTPSWQPAKKLKVEKLTIQPAEKAADTGLVFPVEELLGLMKQKLENPFDYFLFTNDMERIKRYYRQHGYLKVMVRPQRDEVNGRIHLMLLINPGPRVEIVYVGATLPGKIRKEVEEILMEGRFSGLAFADAMLRLRYHFYDSRYYQVGVTCREKSISGDSSRIVFMINKGLLYSRPPILIFAGNRSIKTSVLRSLIKKPPMIYSLFSNPGYVTGSLKYEYFKKGYLQTGIDLPLVVFDEEKQVVRVKFLIEESRRFNVGKIVFQGNRFFDGAKLQRWLGVKPGKKFVPEKYLATEAVIKKNYHAQGFARVRVVSHVEMEPVTGTIDLLYEIEENQRGVIREVSISGNRQTKTRVIRRELVFKRGDALTVEAINKSREKLYDLGVFDEVDMEMVPLGVEREGDTVPYRVLVKVKEQKRYRFKYGFQLKSTLEKGAPVSYLFTGQLSDFNLGGRGYYFDLVGGVGSHEQKVAGYLGLPYFMGRRINTRLYVQYKYNDEPFPLQSAGIGIRQTVNTSKYSLISYDYKLSWNREDEPLAESVYRYRVGSVGLVFRRDSRDNIMDAVKGSYQNYSIDVAQELLASQVDYIRFSGHYSYYKQWGPLVYAGSFRLGLIKEFGRDLPYGERFFAGGGTTIRGFGQDKVGPLVENKPIGGYGLIIMNQELRWRMTTMFGLALFMDMGNVYPRMSDIDLGKMRESVGLGLRVFTPYVLLRLDCGFKLDRRPGEPVYGLSFSIGQAF